MDVPNCPALARIQPVLSSEDFQRFGGVVHDKGGEKNVLVCLKHTHAHRGITRDFETDPEYTQTFQQHQNSIRALAHLLLVRGVPSRMFMEGLMAEEVPPHDLFDIVHDFEKLHGAETKLLDGTVSVPFLNVSGRNILATEIDDEDSSAVVRMRVRSLCGNKRQSAWCLMNGQGHRLHGIETRESEERTDALYEEMSAPFGMLYPNFDRIFREINTLRHDSIVAQVRRHLLNDEVGILVLGTGHFIGGEEGKQIRQVEEPLEHTFARTAPETRVLVVETRTVPPPKGSIG